MCWGSQIFVLLLAACMASWLMPKYSFLPQAVSEKQLRGCGGHPPYKCPENLSQTAPCHDVLSATPASPMTATCYGSTRNMKAVSPLGNSGKECPTLEGVAGGQGRIILVQEQQAKPSCTHSAILQPTPRATRQQTPIRRVPLAPVRMTQPQ